MSTEEIKNYVGTTCLLPAELIVNVNGKTFGYAFDASDPEEVSWKYRVLKSSNPACITDAQLTAILKSRGIVIAKWKRWVGVSVGLLTIEPTASSGGKPLQAECEARPEIVLAPPSPAAPTPQSPSSGQPASTPTPSPAHAPEAQKPYTKSAQPPPGLPEQKEPTVTPAKAKPKKIIMDEPSF
jgi:hypothetical protein